MFDSVYLTIMIYNEVQIIVICYIVFRIKLVFSKIKLGGGGNLVYVKKK